MGERMTKIDPQERIAGLEAEVERLQALMLRQTKLNTKAINRYMVAEAKLERRTAMSDTRTREFCQRCHSISPVGFHSPIWAEVAGRHWADSILCIMCFAAIGDEKYIAWDVGLKLIPVSSKTHRDDPQLQARLDEWMEESNERG